MILRQHSLSVIAQSTVTQSPVTQCTLTPSPIARIKVAGWPASSPGALLEVSEDLFAHDVATLSLPIPGKDESFETIIKALIQSLADVTLALYPSWLPDAARVEGPGGVGLAAVEDIARAAAARSKLFKPFVLLMAGTAVRRQKTVVTSALAQEVVARECIKLIRLAYGVDDVLLVLPALGTSDSQIAAIQMAAIWLSETALCKVWLAGPAAAAMPRITQAPEDLETKLSGLASSSSVTSAGIGTGQSTQALPQITPLTGRPNPFSDAEQRLEARLKSLPWAHGRAWNATWQAGPLRNPIRVDLIWHAERCVVEIDGPDHLGAYKYARDRMRDRDLQMAGFAVLRFTNEEVLQDLEQVTSFLHNFLESRRLAAVENVT